MVKLNKLIKTSGIILASILVCETAFAGTAGDRGGMTGNDCANIEGGGTTGGICTVVWYKYEYTDSKKENTPTIIPFATNRGGAKWGDYLYVGVPDTASTGNDGCFGKSKSFYAKGAALGYTSGTKVSTIYKSQQFGSATATYDSVYGEGKDAKGNTKIDSLEVHDYGTWNGGNNYSYAFSEEFSISPSYSYMDGNKEIKSYHYLGYLYDGSAVNTSYHPSGYRTPVAQGHIVTTEEAKKAFCVAAGKAEDCAAGADVTVDGYSFEGDTKPASWFCAYDSVKKEGYTKGTTSILARDSNGNELAKAEVSKAGNGETYSEVVTIHSLPSPTVTIVSNFKGERDVDKKNTASGYTLETNPIWSSYYRANIKGTESAEKGRFDKGALTAEGETKSVSTKVDLPPGETVQFCSSLTYDHHYQKEGQNIKWLPEGGDTNYNQKACITLKYEPSVAEIDSVTTLDLGAEIIESGKDQAKTHSINEVNYGAKAITATWSYTLSSQKRCYEDNFNNGACDSHESSITGDFTVPFSRVGDLSSSTGSLTLKNPDYSASPKPDNSKSYNLLPGEQITQKQGISHYSGVRTDGVAAKGAKEESSSVTLNATASNVICGLNNQPFGLSDPVNYGRMKVVKNGNRTYVYGDNLVDGSSTWSDAGDIWLRPTDTVQLSYEGCIGEQIAKDKDVADWNAQITEDYKNSIMGVETTDGLLNDPHYTGTGNSIDKDGVNSKNITAHEVLGSTINKHIDAKYQFGEQITKPAQVGNVGRTIINDYKIRSDGSRNVSATMKIPYNYILEPEISAGTKEIVTLGNENTFTISVKNPEVRTNVKVQNDAYQTDVKPGTKAAYLKFVAKTDTSASVLASLNGQFISGDKTGDIASTLSGIDFKNSSGGDIAIPRSGKVDEETVKVSADESDSEYNKLCVAVAVYPADSHNLGGKPEIVEKDDQSAALTDSINGGYTRIAVACKTVGKYPTMSVEGNGIVAGGNVTGAYTEYNNRYFGSWTEYSLIANSVKNFASGASLAYTNPQTTINATAAWDLGGLNKGYFDSPQTLGNMSDEVGLQDEAEASLRASQMQSFVDDVKSTFFAGTPGGSETIMPLNDGKTFVNTNFDGNVVIDSELAETINKKANEGMVLIYSEGNIEISNDVQSLKAVLIADGIVDTCFEKDQGGDNGQLLDYCYNPLVINGVVFSNKDIALDRVYGGGSTDGMNLDPNTLIQRAEIFNFNPEIIEWGYNYKHKTQPITTTYIEELSTRY